MAILISIFDAARQFLSSEKFILAAAIGFLPALFWLWFWQKQDKNPEPRLLVALTFLAGMFAALAALFFEQIVYYVEVWMKKDQTFGGIVIMLFLWAIIEEVVKFWAANRVALKKSDCDEPIDEVIYMITVALGFSALENFLFLFNSAPNEGFFANALTGNFRFLGASLLHVASSAILGASMAFCFFHRHRKIVNISLGMSIAVLLHFTFNYFLYIIGSNGGSVLSVFIPLWVVILFVIFIIEKIKKIKCRYYAKG